MATIQGVYVALFGRPADPTGLAYFNGVTNNGTDLSAINNLAGQKEYTDRFAGQNNVQIVNSIYQSLFGRDAEASGLNFFVDKLNKGELNINNIAIAILDGAQGADKTIVDAKLAAANLFTAALDTPTEVGSYVGNDAAASARTWLAGITTAAQATQASADAAVAAVVTLGGAGNTIALAAADAELSTTVGVGSPAVTTTNKNDTINADAAADSWVATQKIDGGLGIDTLNADLANDLTVQDGSALTPGYLRGVEVLNINASGAATLDLANAVGVTNVTNNGSGAALTVDGIALSVVAGVKGGVTGVATFNFKGATGTADSASVKLDAATASVTVDNIETLNVSNTGVSKITAFTAAKAETVNITGSGSLEVAGFAAAKTIDASGFSGALKFNFNATALTSYVGGTGVDTIDLDVAFAANATINAGAGNDLVTLTLASATKTTTITLGEGADILKIGAVDNVTASAADLAKGLVTVTDFSAANDALVLATKYDALLGAEATQVAGKATLFEAAETAASFIDTAGLSTVFNWGGDAYVLQVAGANVLADGDALVKLTGVSISDLNATNFQYVA